MVPIHILRLALLVLPLAVAGGAQAAAPKAPPVAAASANQQLKRFGEQYCFTCHGEKKQKGDFNFEPLAAKADVLADRKAWAKVAEMLETREMPPEGKPQPREEQRQALVKWIDSLLAAGESGQKNPGRVTLRRLNRGEYRNTIRDLLALEFDPVEFPQDETAFGFDTIADALTIQPLLMEKYLTAAEQIVAALLAGNKLGPPSESHRADKLKSTDSGAVRSIGGGVLGFYREGYGTGDVEFPADGDYTLRFRAYGEQAGPEAPKLAVSFDGKQIAVLDRKSVV